MGVPSGGAAAGGVGARGRSELREEELFDGIAACKSAPALQACLRELCYRRSCASEDVVVGLAGVSALRAAWAAVGDSDQLPLTDTCQLYLSCCVDELKLCAEPGAMQQRLDFAVLLGKVLAGIAGVLSRADSLRSCEDSDAFLQTLSDGICSAPELLRKALPFGTAAAPEALPPAAMLGVAEAVLPLAHTVLLSEPWLSLSGPDRFSRCVASLRAAVKDVLVPAMCELVGVQPRRPGDAAAQESAGSGPGCGEYVVGPLAYCCRQLSELGASVARLINCNDARTPKELKNYGTLNAAWMAAVKLLTAVPQRFRADPEIRRCLGLHSSLDCLVANLAHCMDALVTRFWIQHLAALLQAYPGSAATQVDALLGVLDTVQAAVPPFCDGAADEQGREVQQKLHDAVLPRLRFWLVTVAVDSTPAAGSSAANTD
eukprot:jgi/Tetstr1/442057/TSEL_030236.t1